MPIKVECPKCGKINIESILHIGQEKPCKNCGKAFIVGAEETEKHAEAEISHSTTKAITQRNYGSETELEREDKQGVSKPDIGLMEDLLLPLLLILKEERDCHISEIREKIKENPNIRGNNRNVIDQQISWSLTCLKQLGFIDDPKPKRSYHRITNSGIDITDRKISKLDFKYLVNCTPGIVFRLRNRLFQEMLKTYPFILQPTSRLSSDIPIAKGNKAHISRPTITTDDSGLEKIDLFDRKVIGLYGKRDKLDKYSFDKYGNSSIYLLFDDSPRKRMYIGETNRTYQRLKEHYSTEDFWDRFVVITSPELNKASTLYLERRLLEFARTHQNWVLMDRNPDGQQTNLSEQDKKLFEAELYQDVMELIRLFSVL